MQMPTDQQRVVMWHMHAMKYYSSIKRNECLIPTKTLVTLQRILRSEGNQTEDDMLCDPVVEAVEKGS